MESLETGPEYSYLDPKKTLLMHNYLIMSQIAINLDTNFPLGRKAMGRNGHYAQVGTAAFLSLHCECSLVYDMRAGSQGWKGEDGKAKTQW